MSSLGILHHDARDIREALKSNTYYVYHRKPYADAVPHRIRDARTRKGKLEVRYLVFGEWVLVDAVDAVYQQ
jgi:hypothetical protein